MMLVSMLCSCRKRLEKLSEKDMGMLLQALCSSEGLGAWVSKPKETEERDESAVAAALKPCEVERCSSPAEAGLPSVEQCSVDTSTEHPAELICAGDCEQQSQSPSVKHEEEAQVKETQDVGPPEEPIQAVKEESSGDRVQETSSNSKDEYLQRLFLSVCSVADQLQSKCSKEMRTILKHVFHACQEDDTLSADSDDGSISKESTTASSEQLCTHTHTFTHTYTHTHIHTQVEEEGRDRSCMQSLCVNMLVYNCHRLPGQPLA